MFAKALLIYGPLPGTGFRLQRDGHGRVTYVTARGSEAKQFSHDVQALFREDIKRRYAIRKWSSGHVARVAKMWKNDFLIWIWDEIDKTDNS